MTLLTPVVNGPNLYINGILCTWSSTTTLTVGAGICRDSTNTIDMTIASTLTINTAADGALGLDSGTIANTTWYYVHVIGDSSNKNPTTVMLSASLTAPFLPFGYDAFRHVGTFRTNGSAALLNVQIEGNGSTRQSFWNIEIAVAAVLSASDDAYTAQSLAALVPPTSKVAKLKAFYAPQTAGDKFFLRPTGINHHRTCFLSRCCCWVSHLHLKSICKQMPINLLTNM